MGPQSYVNNVRTKDRQTRRVQKLLARKDYEGFLVRGDEVRLQLADWANSSISPARCKSQVAGSVRVRNDGEGDSSH